LAHLLAAMPHIWKQHPDCRLLVAGPGELDDVDDVVGAAADERVHVLGQVDEAHKARVFRSADVFVAPNTGGESFGIILLEAMAAGTAIVASDLDAFRRVLEAEDGSCAGALATVGDPESLAHACQTLLSSAERRRALRNTGAGIVRRYDWTVVAREIVRVYETAIASSGGPVQEDPEVEEIAVPML
jgi:phosphatidyl-myo-inositol alpha-mannosyltransferase